VDTARERAGEGINFLGQLEQLSLTTRRRAELTVSCMKKSERAICHLAAARLSVPVSPGR
jgi:hypothetical protein